MGRGMDWQMEWMWGETVGPGGHKSGKVGKRTGSSLNVLEKD